MLPVKPCILIEDTLQITSETNCSLTQSVGEVNYLHTSNISRT